MRGQSANSALSASLIAEFIFLPAIPMMDILGDQIDRKPTVTIAQALFLVVTIPTYHFLDGTFATQLIG